MKIILSRLERVKLEAFSYIPKKLRGPLSEVPIVADYDTEIDSDVTFDGRSYADVNYYHPASTDDGSAGYVVMRHRLHRPAILVHELGHALDDMLGATHVAEPVSEYAESNRWEAFAEAFTAYCDLPEYRSLQGYIDEETRELFGALARRGLT